MIEMRNKGRRVRITSVDNMDFKTAALIGLFQVLAAISMSDCLHLGEMLCEKRQRLGLSQMRLAKRIGYNYPCISRIETAAMNPQINRLAQICAALGLEIEIREKKA